MTLQDWLKQHLNKFNHKIFNLTTIRWLSKKFKTFDRTNCKIHAFENCNMVYFFPARTGSTYFDSRYWQTFPLNIAIFSWIHVLPCAGSLQKNSQLIEVIRIREKYLQWQGVQKEAMCLRMHFLFWLKI